MKELLCVDCRKKKVDRADAYVLKSKFFETVNLFLGEGTVILGRSLEGQNNLQYENQQGFVSVNTILW